MLRLMCVLLLAGLLLPGCRSFDDGVSAGTIFVDDLRGTTWQLISINPPPPVSAQQARATAKFWATASEEGQLHLTGYTGCNEYFGSYADTESGRLNISPLGATRRACTPTTASIEEALLLSLPNAQSFEIADNMLTIYCTDDVVFQFRFTFGQ